MFDELSHSSLRYSASTEHLGRVFEHIPSIKRLMRTHLHGICGSLLSSPGGMHLQQTDWAEKDMTLEGKHILDMKDTRVSTHPASLAACSLYD